MRPKLTYANVMATIAVFIAVGGVSYAALKLPKNSVGVNQLKNNAVTTAKIKKNAVTAGKIKNGSIGTAKLAPGVASEANVLGIAAGGPVLAYETGISPVQLSGTTTFTPKAGTVYFLSVEAKGAALSSDPGKECNPIVVPLVNGNEWEVAGHFLEVRAQEPKAGDPTGIRPVSGESGPLGLLSPGIPQAIGAKVVGDPECGFGTGVFVGIAITQLKEGP
jgi:hypothetical protein